MRTVVLWVMFAWQVVATLTIVATIGRQRRPLTPSAAAGTVALCGVFMAGLLYVGGVIG